jgi:hypothetical protein
LADRVSDHVHIHEIHETKQNRRGSAGVRGLSMTKVGVFVHITLDGFFAGPNGEIDWFKVIKKDPEWEKHTHQESQSGSTVLMGRTTYEMMRSFWPTPAGIASDPHMAKVMNESPKIVVSKSLPDVIWCLRWSFTLYPPPMLLSATKSLCAGSNKKAAADHRI